MKWLRKLAVLLVVATLLGSAVQPAQAHAELLHSVPDANASLPQAPALVELFFSEAVEGKLSHINVFDNHNNRVDLGDTRLDPNDPTHLIVSLKPLGYGIFTVSWSAISAADGHQTTGSFPFGVGQVTPQALASSVTGVNAHGPVPPGELISKLLLYLAAVLLMGVQLFTYLAWNPSVKQAGLESDQPGAYAKNARRLTIIALALLAVVDVLSLFLQAGEVNGSLIGWPWQPEFITLLLDTRIGVLAIARLALAALLAGMLLPPPSRWNRGVGLAACILLMLTFSLESHAAAEPHPLLPVLGDWMHMIAVSVWIGGLFSFFESLNLVRRLPSDQSTRLTAFLIPHFSNLALSSVGVLILTGIYEAILRIGSFNGLFNTTYGRALILKLLIALPMIVLGAINLLITTPNLRRASQEPGGSRHQVSRFYKLLLTEVIIAIVLLVWVSVFTSLPPVRSASTLPGYTAVTQADDLQVSLNINPGRPGMNTFTVSLTSGGKPVTDAKEVSLEFVSLTGMMPASKANLKNRGDGSYSQTGGYMGMVDNWDVKAVVIRINKFDAYADYKLDWSQMPQTETPIPWRQSAAVLVFLLAFCYSLSWKFLDPKFWRWVGLAAVPAWALAILAMWIFLQSATPARAEPSNPVPPVTSSVAAGKELYQQDCLPCHGATGKGDGPLGVTLSPHPADLTQHTRPGVHSDAQLFDWITNGYPGSSMPAFGKQLTDQQRWNIVNYLRTLATP